MAQNIITATNPPQANYMSVFTWERGLDPFHADAFPMEFQAQVRLTHKDPRRAGWEGIDVPDGTVEELKG